jgi:hypothetical protein
MTFLPLVVPLQASLPRRARIIANFHADDRRFSFDQNLRRPGNGLRAMIGAQRQRRPPSGWIDVIRSMRREFYAPCRWCCSSIKVPLFQKHLGLCGSDFIRVTMQVPSAGNGARFI